MQHRLIYQGQALAMSTSFSALECTARMLIVRLCMIHTGLAGFYITDDSKAMGGCGAPWNLDYVEQRHLMLADKVLDNKCQLSFEKEGRHRNSLYGDINTVYANPCFIHTHCAIET
jgi:hypothetical protein